MKILVSALHEYIQSENITPMCYRLSSVPSCCSTNGSEIIVKVATGNWQY